MPRPIVVRRCGDEIEMVELLWGLRPRSPDERSNTAVPVAERRFPSHRWLVPASEFRHRSRGKDDRFRLPSGTGSISRGSGDPRRPSSPKPTRLSPLV